MWHLCNYEFIYNKNSGKIPPQFNNKLITITGPLMVTSVRIGITFM